jgi:hypothetical protein
LPHAPSIVARSKRQAFRCVKTPSWKTTVFCNVRHALLRVERSGSENNFLQNLEGDSMLKKLGALTMMLIGTAAFLQPTVARAQSPYDRGYYSYNDRGYRDGYYGNRRDFERNERWEREARKQAWREQKRREHEWREHERWERRNNYYNGYYNNPYYRYPY